jgi:hypothetical protein
LLTIVHLYFYTNGILLDASHPFLPGAQHAQIFSWTTRSAISILIITGV